jgi:hypothetical protein
MSRAVSNGESAGLGRVVREGRPRFCVVGRQPLMKWQRLSSGMCFVGACVEQVNALQALDDCERRVRMSEAAKPGPGRAM